jgi:hypothetical protein
MKTSQPPRLALALLERCVPDNEALIGDLVEAFAIRSNLWFWRQALFAVLSRTSLQLRAKPFLTTEKFLITTAMLGLLGFYTVVVATLMTRLIVLSDGWYPQTGRFQELQLYFAIPAFAAAILMGRVIGRLHHNHRMLCVLGCSIAATGAACLNLYFFVPNILLLPLAPHVATQIVVGMIFIAGLFVGIDSRSPCETQPSS